MFTHPDHRRRGAGTLLMDWGIKLADQWGLESFIQEFLIKEGFLSKESELEINSPRPF